MLLEIMHLSRSSSIFNREILAQSATIIYFFAEYFLLSGIYITIIIFNYLNFGIDSSDMYYRNHYYRELRREAIIPNL